MMFPLTYNALVLRDTSHELSLEPLTIAAPTGTEVVIEINAAGVCHSDLHARQGDWDAPLPATLGHEGAGVVVAIGDAVQSLEVGDHVALSWVAPCRNCAACADGRGWACDTANDFSAHAARATQSPLDAAGHPVSPYLGVGSFAEYTVVPETAAIRISPAVPFDIAALMSCAVATGMGAVFHNAGVSAGSRVVVVGAGGIGLSIIMACKLAGATQIIAVDLARDKLALAEELGATASVLAGDSHAREVLGSLLPNGADVTFDAVGSIPTMSQALSLLSRGGKCVLVGMPPEGQSLSIDPLTFASMGQTLVGSNFGSTVPLRDFPRIAELFLTGRLPLNKLITDHANLADVDDAFDRMLRGEGARTVVLPRAAASESASDLSRQQKKD